jgi:hypothetical protein
MREGGGGDTYIRMYLCLNVSKRERECEGKRACKDACACECECDCERVMSATQRRKDSLSTRSLFVRVSASVSVIVNVCATQRLTLHQKSLRVA